MTHDANGALEFLDRPGRVTWRQAVGTVMLFGVALAGTMGAALSVPPMKPQARQTMEEFERYRDETAVLLAGSSLVQRQLIPEIIGDGVYNIGFPNASYAETERVLRGIFSRPTPRLRVLVLEVRPTAQGERLHDIIRGQGVALIRDWTGRHDKAVLQRGYFDRTINPSDDAAEARRQRFVELLQQTGHHVQIDPHVPDPIDVDRRGLRRIVALAESHGVEVVLLQPPLNMIYPDLGLGLSVLDFSSPEEYPRLVPFIEAMELRTFDA